MTFCSVCPSGYHTCLPFLQVQKLMTMKNKSLGWKTMQSCSSITRAIFKGKRQWSSNSLFISAIMVPWRFAGSESQKQDIGKQIYCLTNLKHHSLQKNWISSFIFRSQCLLYYRLFQNIFVQYRFYWVKELQDFFSIKKAFHFDWKRRQKCNKSMS